MFGPCRLPAYLHMKEAQILPIQDPGGNSKRKPNGRFLEGCNIYKGYLDLKCF